MGKSGGRSLRNDVRAEQAFCGKTINVRTSFDGRIVTAQKVRTQRIDRNEDDSLSVLFSLDREHSDIIAEANLNVRKIGQDQ